MKERIRYPRKVIEAKCDKRVVVTTLPDGVLIQLESGMVAMSKEQLLKLINVLQAAT